MCRLVVFIVLASWTASAYSQSCHLRELDICAASLAAVASTESDDGLTDNDLDRFCKFLGETGDCLQSYMERCTTDDFMDAIDPFLGLSDNFEEQLCAQNSSLRRSLLEQSKCMFKIGRNNKDCLKESINSLEYIFVGNHNASMKTDLACCLFNRMSDCTKEVALQQCGLEATESLYSWTSDFKRRLGGRLLEYKCDTHLQDRKYVCDSLPKLGKPWDRPKNKKVKSILAKLIKQYRTFSE